MNTLYRAALLGATLLSLCVSAQTVQKITDAPVSNSGGSSQIIDYASFFGKVYVIHESEPHQRRAFATMDLTTGQLTFIPYDEAIDAGEVSSRNQSRYFRVGDRLVARVGGSPLTQALYSVNTQGVERLTGPGLAVVSEAVPFKGTHYFLALRDFGSLDADNNHTVNRSIYLYKTDGTPEGTVEVMQLPHPGYFNYADLSFEEPRLTHWLKAGTDRLLISAQQHDGPTLHLYNPQSESLTHIRLAPGDDLADQALFFQYSHDDRGYDPGPAVDVAYADGSFYMAESFTNVIYRIDEASGAMTAVNDPEGILSNAPWNTVYSFAATDDGEVFVQVYNPLIYESTVASITGSDIPTLSTLSESIYAPDAPIQTDGSRIFYLSEENGTPTVFAYEPTTMGTTNLFSLSGEIVINSEYEFVVDGNFLYLLERYGGFSSTPAYRFSLTTQNLTLIPSGNERGDYAITDDGIVFNGFGELDGHASIKPQYLARDQNEPTVYAPAEDYRFGGVYFAAPAGGNTVRISYNADDGFKRERYDPATGTTTGLNSEFPGVTTSSAYFAGVVGDQLIVRENSSDGTSFYAYIDEKPEPLIDAESNQPFRLPRGVLRLYNHIYWVNYGTEFPPEVRAVEGMEVSLIATGQTTTLALSDITLSGGRVTMRFSGRTIGSDTKFFIVDDRSGTVLMDSLLSSLHYRHLVSAESGTWFAHHDTLADAYSLRYIRYDGTPATSIPLTGNLEPAGRLDPMAIGERLLFNLPDETGSRWWSADAAAGTITAMPGARPLGDHSDFDLYAQSTPSAVFYAGVNDERNEVTLWRTDGTPDGTYQVADINPTPSLAFSSNTRYNDSLLVLAAAGPQGVEPYVVDMTAEDRTALLADINPGGGHSYPDDIIVWDEGVYFTAYPDAQGARQLYYVQDFNTSTPRLQTVVRLSLYPNPTTERARVEVTDQHQLREIEVMDNLGRRVLRQAGGGQRAELDVSRLPAGTYHVISHFVDGGRGYGKLSVAR